MSPAVDRTALFTALHDAQTAADLARQAITDSLEALRTCTWGKISKASWDYSYESDDQGGSYISINTAIVTIAGKDYHLGYNFQDLLEEGDEIEEGSDLETLVTKYTLAGVSEVDAFKHALAELAEISNEEFDEFLELTQVLVDENKEAGEISFT